MKEGDKVLIEGEVTAVNPEWLMVRVIGLQGVERVRARKAIVHAPAKPAVAAQKAKATT